MALGALVLVPAGVAVAAAASGGTPNTAPPPSNVSAGGDPLISAGSVRATTIGDQLKVRGKLPVSALNKLRMINAGSVATMAGIPPTALVPGDNASHSTGAGGDAQLQAKLDTIESYGKAAYNNLDDAAKKKGAEIANKALKLDPPLKGNESWEDLSGAVGSAAGLAALGWIPGGQVLGPIVGAYLGVKLEQLIAGNVDDVKKWFTARWANIEGWVHGAYDDVSDAAHDAIDYIGSWF